MSDPDYIKYLLSPDQCYDCYFVVGNPHLNTPLEKIGAVKKMLLAHSLVLRAELEESKIAEKSTVTVTDIYPDTFRNMLRFVYGYDNTVGLSFDDADNLLYAAEKYMVRGLKDKLARRLMDMLDYRNICSLMNNPACFRVLELNAQITKILQHETDRVLASRQFLGLSPEAFLTVLQQETLNVPEIQVWRAAVKWAKNRADGEEGQELRKALTRHMQHIRVCTLTLDELCGDVLPTEVLSYDEFRLVCLSVRSGEKQDRLTSVCNEVEERRKAAIRSDPTKVKLLGRLSCYNDQNKESTIRLVTKEHDLELISMRFSALGSPTHTCDSTIQIQTDGEAAVVVRFNDLVTKDSVFIIPIFNNGENVRLLANSSYLITFRLCASLGHWAYFSENKRIVTNYDLTVFFLDKDVDEDFIYPMPPVFSTGP